MNILKSLLLGLLAAASLATHAQEASIRKNLAERLPDMPAIEEISKTPYPGLWEVRVHGNRLFYTDDNGSYVMLGPIIDTKSRTNITEERLERLNAVAFKDLPLKDTFKIVKGKGTRVIATFEDPNCGYCKRLGKELAQMEDVTVYTFLYPILGPDSTAKSRDIWCAGDAGKVWRDWMLDGVVPPPAECDTAAIERNSRLAARHGINGTPTLIFANDTRVPGDIPADRFEAMLKEARAR